MRVHFIQHEDFENPGAYLDWADRKSTRLNSSHIL